MSTTQTPPRGHQPPATAPEAPGLYDARHWETAYRHFDEDAVPQLLLHLQDDLTRSRKREAAWLSVIVHLLVIILFVNQPRIEGFYRRVFLHQQPVMSVSVQDLLRRKELTYIELPPDLQKIPKRPNTDVVSDKDRTASTRTPQVDPKELKKLMASPRPGTPGTKGTPAPPAISEASPSQQAQNNGGQQAPQQGSPPPQTQNQISQLQPPVQPQIKFGGSMSAGSQIDQATRAAAQNRGGYGGDGGDFGLNQGARGGAQGQLEVFTDTMGVDFNPYLARVLHDVKQNWYSLIPESAQWKKGRVVLEFYILKDGSVAGLRVIPPQGDPALERPAYGSITASNPFPPLPKEFPGPYLGLRFSYYYNLNVDGSEIH